ncbi:hypothetical protein LUZ63_005732 [Rhynchospora breviuscula]|uniref:Uncharacterized protein n=1 Tax=Rhynchospora breviuscula TaxID=2022672 RepID=A0A9Q0CP01_9POAL|nr:hypothetical protein LUZ63_005732 [Rhynchospora breviuscula]
MLVINQSPTGALSGRRLPPATPRLFSGSKSAFRKARCGTSRPRIVSLSSPDNAGPTTSGRTQPPPPAPPSTAGGSPQQPVSLTEEGVPLEGVIRIEKPGGGGIYQKIQSWGQIGLLAGGDVLCLLIFSAIGRFSHGLPFLDLETLKTADPFVAGWILSAYFFGAYGDDGKGKNGSTSAVFAAAKSWAVGIPLGIGIRAAKLGHVPATPFVLVTMGSTSVLLILWRFIASKILSGGQKQQNDDYRRGNPFELFELLTSLVRRW